MARLTSIVWPAVRRLVAERREEMAERVVQICVAEAALILESGFEAQMDEVWVVFVPRATAKERLMARNGLSGEEADKRLNSQVGCEGLHKGLERVGFAVSDGQREDEAQNESRAEEADGPGLTGGLAVYRRRLLRSPRCVVSWMIFKGLLLCNVSGHGKEVQI
jgi:hypothetical protein